MIKRKSHLREKQDASEKLTLEHTRIGQILTIRFEELCYDFLIMEKKTGMSRAKIKRIFIGTQDWTLSDILKVCDALNLTLKDLV